jgi:hypothetical protein
MLDQIQHALQQSMQRVRSIGDNIENIRRSDELLLLTIDQDEDHITGEERKQLNAQMRVSIGKF